MRHAAVLGLVLIASCAMPAHGQILDRFKLDRINNQLAGRVIDFSHNHGADRRIFSNILGRPRDLYVYLPPCYNPSRQYPLIIYMHFAGIDEHWFVGSAQLRDLDAMIQRGEVPPVILAIPDGLIEGENKVRAPHSMFLNGVRGRFEDHILQEILPFMTTNYSVRPEREARALLGSSAGGMGAASIGLRHPEIFGAVATIGAPLNIRYDTCSGDYRENFDPARFRWKQSYDPDQIVARFYFGLWRVRADKYIAPVFGDDLPNVPGRTSLMNPAELVVGSQVAPGYPFFYVNYGGKDNYNFDAQAESFVYFARQRGIPIDIDVDPKGRHDLPYFNRNHALAYRWLARHILPPTP